MAWENNKQNAPIYIGVVFFGWLLFLGGCKDKKSLYVLNEEIGVSLSMVQFLEKFEISPKEWILSLKKQLQVLPNVRFVKVSGKQPNNQLSFELSFQSSVLTPTPAFLKKSQPPTVQRFLVFEILISLQEASQKHSFSVFDSLLFESPQEAQKKIKKKLFGLWNQAQKSLVIWLSLRKQGVEVWKKQLKNQDKFKVAHSLFFLGEQKQKASASLILKVLQRKEKEIILAAISALSKIKDPKTASSLIDLSKNKDSSFQKQIVTALGEIGGEDAKSHLYTLSAAHPDPSIRKSAKEAYDEILRRKK